MLVSMYSRNASRGVYTGIEETIEVAHNCSWPECTKSTDLLMCKIHWYKLPPQLRQRLMAEHVKGKAYKTEAYNQTLKEIEKFVSLHGGAA